MLVIVVAQKSAVEAEMARTKDELTSIRQQMKESTAETTTSQTQTDEVSMAAATADDSEIVELREQLQKSAEALSSQRNKADLLQQQLQSQTREIDALRDALSSKVADFVHTHTHVHMTCQSPGVFSLTVRGQGTTTATVL